MHLTDTIYKSSVFIKATLVNYSLPYYTAFNTATIPPSPPYHSLQALNESDQYCTPYNAPDTAVLIPEIILNQYQNKI